MTSLLVGTRRLSTFAVPIKQEQEKLAELQADDGDAKLIEEAKIALSTGQTDRARLAGPPRSVRAHGQAARGAATRSAAWSRRPAAIHACNWSSG